METQYHVSIGGSVTKGRRVPSWCINRRVDGGLELPPKLVQERLGHATLTMTMDVYGHLFPRGEWAERS